MSPITPEYTRREFISTAAATAAITLLPAAARWEFSLAASNLPKAIAPDIRRLLRLVS